MCFISYEGMRWLINKEPPNRVLIVNVYLKDIKKNERKKKKLTDGG